MLSLPLIVALSWVAAWTLLDGPTRRSRVGGILETFVIWQTALTALMYAFGFASRLNSVTVGATVSVVAIAVAAFRFRDGELRRDFLHHWRALSRVPWQALRAAYAQNALLIVPVLSAFAVFGWLLAATWLLPPGNWWDSMWYHDTITGFTIQNQGFAAVELPASTQAVNGVPRSVNMAQTFVGLFAGRRLIELPNVFALLLGALAIFGLCRRFEVRAGVATALGCLFILIPGNYRLATSTMVDPYSAMLTVVAAYFLLKRQLRVRDILMVGGATATLVGSKYVALVPAGTIMLILLARGLFAFLRARSEPSEASASRVLLGLVVASTLVVAMMAATFARNWVLFENPVWPHGATIERLDIDWKAAEPKTGISSGKEVPFLQQLKLFWAIPRSVKSPHFTSTGTYDFGVAINWLVLPIGLVLALWLLVTALTRRIRGRQKQQDEDGLLLLALLAWTQLIVFPPIWAARYQLGAAALLFVTVGWISTRPRWRREGTALVVIAGFLAAMNVMWSAQKNAFPRADWMWGQLRNPSELLDIDERYGAPVQRKVALERERLEPGQLVAYDSMAFPSLLFNNRYDNHVAYLPSKDFLESAEERGATWIYVRNKKLQRRASKDPRWKRLGVLEAVRRARRGVVFRHVRQPL